MGFISFWLYTLVKVVYFHEVLQMSNGLRTLRVPNEVYFLCLAPATWYTVRVA